MGLIPRQNQTLRQIPAFKYYFPPAMVGWITDQIRQLLESGDYLTLGKRAEQFEREYAQYVGTKYAIATSSGTSALEAVLRAIDVRDKEVIVPTNTFAATAFAVLHAGGRPVLADIGNDLSISEEDLKRRLTPRTRAIITVHIGGFISDSIEELKDFAEEKGIALMEDAAHAQGSMLRGRKAGSFGAAAGSSFFSTKVITTGEGGMVTTSDDAIQKTVRLLRDQAKVQGNWVDGLGYNWRMSEFQAIIGLAQLRAIEEIIEKRTAIAARYDELLEDSRNLELLSNPLGARPNYYKHVIFPHKGLIPENIKNRLKQKYGISLSGYVYEAPLHRQSTFASSISDPASYPVADDLCNRHICPPLYPQMSTEEAEYVAQSIALTLEELSH